MTFNAPSAAHGHPPVPFTTFAFNLAPPLFLPTCNDRPRCFPCPPAPPVPSVQTGPDGMPGTHPAGLAGRCRCQRLAAPAGRRADRARRPLHPSLQAERHRPPRAAGRHRRCVRRKARAPARDVRRRARGAARTPGDAARSPRGGAAVGRRRAHRLDRAQHRDARAGEAQRRSVRPAMESVRAVGRHQPAGGLGRHDRLVCGARGRHRQRRGAACGAGSAPGVGGYDFIAGTPASNDGDGRDAGARDPGDHGCNGGASS